MKSTKQGGKKRRIIRSIWTGSKGPMLRKATVYDWVGDPVPGSFHLLHNPKGRSALLDMARHYDKMLAHCAEYLDSAGDNFLNLAATQLGALRRLLVFQAGPDATPSALANPVIEWSSDELVTTAEGCLSLPRIIVDVERPLHVRVSGQDTAGEPILIEASGLEARVLQHELDHLDGVLILDRTEREQRKGAMRALREGTGFSPEPEPEDEQEPE